MQVYVNSNGLAPKTILFFILVCIAAFLPIASFQFFLKNDAFTGYFPPKFFMSESLHAGYLPLWNPYINFGIPQYGDMNSGYWSPVTWIIASTTGYNAYSFTIEELFYLIVGGIGMWKALSHWNLQKYVCLIGGVAYMCCGYNTGHLQHFNWVSGAAFLPWCVWAYLLLLKKLSLRNILLSAMMFYMLIASAHPGIIIGSAYFFIAFFLFYFFLIRTPQDFPGRLKQAAKVHASLILLLLLLCAGLIAGYADILPHFVRGDKISLESALSEPTSIQCWLSALLPFATVKNDAFYSTDISMRNCYFSLILFIFFLYAALRRKDSWQKFLLITGILFLLLSSGGIFKSIAYRWFPLIGYVRLNGEFRIISLLCFIVTGAIALDRAALQEKKFSGLLKYISWSIGILLLILTIGGLYKGLAQKQSFLYQHSLILSHDGATMKLKSLIDSITFYDTMWIQGCIQLIFLLLITTSIKRRNWKALKAIVVADMILACLMNVPFTGAGKAPVSVVQSIIDKSPTGIPIPPLVPIRENDTLDYEVKSIVGDWSFYNKKIGVINEAFYPVALKNQRAYFDQKNSQISVDDEAFLFTTNPYDSLRVVSFQANEVAARVISKGNSTLIYLQNYYPHWYYESSGGKNQVNKVGVNFMSAPVKQGIEMYKFVFEPVAVRQMMLLSAVLFMLGVLLLILLPFLKRL